MKNNVAIIIPYYKITFFEDCLNSLVNQTNKNFNVYIGNDNSPNDPKELIEKYSDQLQINYKKFDDNLGKDNLVLQWDRCINMSKQEEWIMILGDDDTLAPNVIEEFYKTTQGTEEKIELIRLASKLIDEKGETISKVYYNPELELAKDFFIRCQNGEARCSLTEHFFTRRCYDKHGFKNFPVAFGSDNVAWLEFSEMGNVMGINNAIANIRISSENLSSIKDRKLGFKRVEGYYKYYRYIIENLGSYFSVEEKEFILNKTYSYLRIHNRSILTAFEYILFMVNRIGFKRTIKIIKNNRHRNE